MNGVAIGYGAYQNQDDPGFNSGVAVGRLSRAESPESIAIGHAAESKINSAIQIGTGSNYQPSSFKTVGGHLTALFSWDGSGDGTIHIVPEESIVGKFIRLVGVWKQSGGWFYKNFSMRVDSEGVLDPLDVPLVNSTMGKGLLL